ncbi:putative ribosome biosynthesis protein GDT1 KNAG_0A03600 [Huiozyma naganishii CBS 8797]|uniref:GDT1 family protein n=1 Tax=Huiozyma naganishii (strain ATCC MYA-139 / BCRC 22969 / CBS 8797 / KCTC 17520 / NBRC 10181 / NCYC 3082 / Yp74L-3) TaxID=1071383 RepID=J7S3L3_HUIN7|nr:hypothetical protein KNAG_0A03600 [Kazachstania naganishii CBS 8797]CCK68041.1 hypothetical protein KNAG_0A03600 [Kazachstania naganishii CBS 8797]
MRPTSKVAALSVFVLGITTVAAVSSTISTGTVATARSIPPPVEQANVGTSDAGDISHSPQKAFIMALSMIGLSEIGDKTFLIAALMAMRHSRLFVFSAAASSLTVMTILSGVIGHSFVAFIPERYTAFLAGLLFLVFGYKLTMEGLAMPKDSGVEEEMAEVEEEIVEIDMGSRKNDVESGLHDGSHVSTFSTVYDLASLVFSPAWVQIFIMVFLGEMGDRSQISIIAMASDSAYWFTIFGGVVGHAFCTALAVIGGKYLATKISMRTMTLVGALFFYIFAASYIISAFV